MNRIHHWYCASSRWRRRVSRDLVPWALDRVRLEVPALEIGPGPGLTTELLLGRLPHLTLLEQDPELARGLAGRWPARDVRVVRGDAASLPFPDGAFRTVFSFTMLHHVPSAELQDRVLAEAGRVLAPGGRLVGTDSRDSLRMRIFHLGDTMVLSEPETFPGRLRAAGFEDASVEVGSGAFRFRALR